MDNYQQVVFLEEPISGLPVKMLINGLEAVSSPVVELKTNINHPGWFWIVTQSGSQYMGQNQKLMPAPNTTMYSMYPNLPVVNQQKQPYVIDDTLIIIALVVFTPLGIALMWRYCNWLSKVKWTITSIWVGLIWLYFAVLWPML